MTISLLMHLSVFCLFRLLFAVNPNSNVTLIMADITNLGGPLFPLVTVLLLGLQGDILQVWFPCIVFSAPQTCTTESNQALDKEVLPIPNEDVAPPESLPDMHDIC
ncbi:hypothetical protein JB92DRAFT_2827544 [Gautieria morchelliformis]|nr:hypothetical protein JB92DRAFT_2827544 [Gautieria morchelliformis]